MFLRAVVAFTISLLLVACGGKTQAPVSDRSLSSTAAPSSGQYIVGAGDTLYSIAFRYGLDYRELARINNISGSYSIYPGQRLQLKVTRTVPTSESIVREASLGAAPKQTVQPRKATKAPPRKPAATKPSSSSRTKSSTVSKNNAQQKPVSSRKPIKYVASGPVKWRWPATGKVSEYFKTKGTVNKGINIAGTKGSAVVAAANGKVVYAGNGLLGYGNLVIVDHDQQFLSAYAHNSRVLVKENDMVKAGQKIAEMGKTGADRVMLHFEIRRDGKPMNPLKYLPKK